jgi:starch-binding outer membrane protein, SusD/RagB family
MKSGRLILFIIFSTMLIYGCTKLHETVGGNLTSVQVTNDSSATVLLRGVYNSLELPFTSYQQIFPLSDISTDEAIVPTRANNWDDDGIWREMHQQKWNSNSKLIHDCFNGLSGIVFAATDMLQYNPTVQQQAEARFLRAWAMYWQLDLFDQVPFRDAGESVVNAARVRKGMEALNYIISEITAIEPDLLIGPASKGNKSAAKTLLMKCYLNRAVYINRAHPSFDVTDMNTVIGLADEIINSNQYTFSTNYFDNFSPVNADPMIAKENIFTQQSNSDGNYLISMAWLGPLDYAQGGFNGFSTLPDFYNKFDSVDKRRGAVYSYPNSPPNPGNRVNVGFLIGQQYDLNTDAPLYSGPLPVIYTPDVQNIEPGPNVEMPGIRPLKYAPDYLYYAWWYGPPGNNFVYFRLPDVLLMKAEAILRGGTGTNAGPYGNNPKDIVNAIRTDPSRGVAAMSSVTLDSIIAERGRELWWENWRRQDMIRFGKFLLPFQEKDYISDPKYLVFPIPDEQLAVNPNLVQNPGY